MRTGERKLKFDTSARNKCKSIASYALTVNTHNINSLERPFCILPPNQSVIASWTNFRTRKVAEVLYIK